MSDEIEQIEYIEVDPDEDDRPGDRIMYYRDPPQRTPKQAEQMKAIYKQLAGPPIKTFGKRAE